MQLLKRLNDELDHIEERYEVEMTKRYYDRREVIRQIYDQQYRFFITGKKPKHRIVSISKSYIRPIIRVKETKAVEFGAKVNKVQIDGISFIEHLSFEAFFNEGTHFNRQYR